jgi:heat shock protein HslJ
VGTTGCNTYNATFTSNLNEIKVNLPSTTQNEDCPWGKGNYEVEQQYFLGLNSATRYRIIGDILQIVYGESPNVQVLNYVASTPPVIPPIEPEPVLELTPLDNTFWYLVALGRRPTLAGTEVTAQFAVNANGVTAIMSGSGGCNDYSTDIGPNFAVGPIASTKKACQQPVSDQENAYFSWLQTAYTYSLAGNQLIIPTSRGVLTYSTERPTLPEVAPTAVIRAPEFGDTGQPVVFDGSASSAGTSPIARYEWNMADGTFLVGQTVQYTYDKPGPYDVQLKVIDEVGKVGEAYHTIMINPVVEVSGPTAVIRAPDFGDTGQAITFDGSASTQGTAAIDRYEWNMGDGSVQNGPTIQHTYDQPGGYEVQLKVIDVAGQVDEAIHSIMINPVVEVTPPTAAIRAPDFGNTGQAVTFDGSASTQGTAAIDRYEWNMGDGSVQNGPTVQHTYDQPGGYEVQLKVIDAAGQVGEDVHSIMINPAVEVTGPKAVIQGPPTAMVGEPVTYSAANSQQGTGAVTGFIWQSGDGQDTPQTPDNTFTVTYNQPGTYNPAVTVIDANGMTDSSATQIQIQAESTEIPLEGTPWALQGTLPETLITIQFGNGTLSGNGGCNTYNAGYSSTKAAGSSNSISVGPITSTQMACPDEIMAQEQSYLASLQTASAYSISGATLTLTTALGPLIYGAPVAVPLASP